MKVKVLKNCIDSCQTKLLWNREGETGEISESPTLGEPQSHSLQVISTESRICPCKDDALSCKVRARNGVGFTKGSHRSGIFWTWVTRNFAAPKISHYISTATSFSTLQGLQLNSLQLCEKNEEKEISGVEKRACFSDLFCETLQKCVEKTTKAAHRECEWRPEQSW